MPNCPEIVTVATANYFIYAKKMVKSIIHHNPNYDNVILVVSPYDPSQKKDQDEIREIYEKVIFLCPHTQLYRDYNKLDAKYFSLEAFTRPGETIIFMDADMICMKPIDWSEFYRYKGIGMIREIRRPTAFNAGFMVLGEDVRTKDIYTQLLMANYDHIKSFGVDQKLYNHFFAGNIKQIDAKWNTLVTEIDNLENVNFLHYIHKPDTEKGLRFYEDKKHLVDIWYNY